MRAPALTLLHGDSFADLELPAKDYTRPCRAMSPYQFKRRLTDPTLHPCPLDLPRPVVDLPHNGTCNGYMPGSSPHARLLWTVQALVAHGAHAGRPQGGMGLGRRR